MKEHLRIALVGYLNTLPFEYGLKKLSNSDQIQLILDTPAACARLFADGLVDLALVPVGALSSLPPHEIVLDYCIGCNGPVRTVVLFSNDSPDQWHTVRLDTHSRTSRLLAQVIIRDHLNLEIAYEDSRISKMPPLGAGEAALMIGDKVFDGEDKYAYKLDLGAAWQEMTAMPFVFAVWIKRKELALDEDLVNQALQAGIAKIPDLVAVHADQSGLSKEDVDSYINDNLRYTYGPSQKAAVAHFQSIISTGDWA
jgi:chorismate dehydratase